MSTGTGAVFLVGMATLACGSSGPNRDAAPAQQTDGGGDGGDAQGADAQGASDAQPAIAPATAGEACMQLNEAETRLAARCQGGAPIDWRSYYASVQNCDTFARHVAEGRAEYRPETWAACLTKYELPCGQAHPYPCYFEILHGKVADGQRCEDTEVCGTISACLNLSGDDCGDVCVRFAGENEACGVYCGGTTPCFDATVCATDLYCRTTDNVCVKAKSLGDACGGPELATCAFGLYCDADPSDPTAPGTCKTLQSGGACRSNKGCPPNEFCLAGTCRARRALGASCADVDDSCVPWTSCQGAVCVQAGGATQPCGPNQACSFNGTCDGTTCQSNGAAGDSCTTLICRQGTRCDSSSNTCMTCPL